MKTLTDLVPEIHPNQLQLIWREIEASLPKLSDDHGRECFGLSCICGTNERNRVLNNVNKALRGFIGGIDE